MPKPILSPSRSTTTSVSTASSSTVSSVSASSEDSAAASIVQPCTCKMMCPRHRISTQDFVTNIPALESTGGESTTAPAACTPAAASSSDGDAIERLWVAVENLSVDRDVRGNGDDQSAMRRSGFLLAGEYGEDEMPDLSHISFPVWVVWMGFDGRRALHGVYPDWGHAGQVTQGVSQARHMRYDKAPLLWVDWRDAHVGNNGRRAFDNGSTLWHGSLLGRVVTRAELVARIRDHATANGVDPDRDDTITALVSDVLLPAVQHPNPQPPQPAPVHDYFFAVIRRTEPGLYFSRDEYKEALGRHRKRWGFVAHTEEGAENFLLANSDKQQRL